MSEFISNEELEKQFAEAMAPVEGSGRLIITGLNLTTGEADTDVFTVTDVATPTTAKTVLLLIQSATGEQYKMVIETLNPEEENENA